MRRSSFHAPSIRETSGEDKGVGFSLQVCFPIFRACYFGIDMGSFKGDMDIDVEVDVAVLPL